MSDIIFFIFIVKEKNKKDVSKHFSSRFFLIIECFCKRISKLVKLFLYTTI